MFFAVYTLATRSDLSQNVLIRLVIVTKCFKDKLRVFSPLGLIPLRNITTICMSFDLKVLSFHSFDCQCFGSYVVSQLTSGDGLSVGMAHVHMAEHDDFSILPSCLRSSRGCAMLTPHLVKLFCSRSAFLGLVC